MLDRIKGKILQKTPVSVVIDCNGMGFNILIPLSTYEKLPESGEIEIFTQIVIKQDGIEIYGFFTDEEREVFKILRKVSNVGPKTALSILSTLGTDGFRDAILHKDAELLFSVKGVGKKTAERIIVELKDLFGKEDLRIGSRMEIVDALVSLGFSKKEALSLVLAILKEDSSLSTEEMIKEALRRR